MDIEKVIQDLNRRFAAPLPEYYHRRIIFWHDEDREFEGVVPLSSLIIEVTGKDKKEINEIIQNAIDL